MSLMFFLRDNDIQIREQHHDVANGKMTKNWIKNFLSNIGCSVRTKIIHAADDDAKSADNKLSSRMIVILQELHIKWERVKNVSIII